MTDLLLTLNAGSSSIKFAVFELLAGRPVARATGQVEGLGSAAAFRAKTLADGARTDRALDAGGTLDHRGALTHILGWIESTFPGAAVAGVGHRVVHGGVPFTEPVLVDDGVIATLELLVPLAPLHQPHNLAGIRAARAAFPAAPQVVCFDTAFHRGHPFVSDTFGLPRQYYDEGVRRYGFHGLSYEFVAAKLREIAPAEAAGGVVVAHLGNGASMCAIDNGRSIASTMSFTALDGLPMGTRCGQLDPGVLLYLMSEKKLDAAAISDLLYKQSGLKGLSNISNDMRALETSSEPAAAEAIAYFVERIRRELGSLAMTLPQLDTVVFTGGIGENSTLVRAAVLAGLEWFGIVLDPAANAAGEAVISTPDSRVTVRVVRTDEEAMIAAHTVRVAALGEIAAAA